MINDDDFEHTCDYLLAKNAHSFINDMDERSEENRYELIGAQSERNSLDLEFDDWTRANGFVNTSDEEIVELVRKGRWVWLEFDSTDQVESIKNSKVLNELFLEIKDVSYDFVPDERCVWIDLVGLPLASWAPE
nr:RNA-directed DNA polymerase, eukaryota [Tanacetum cinerariifolium]